jgi:succinate dehydrogenase / fumarate reductase flavoprotein subunit
MSESARGEGGRVWVPKIPSDTRPARSIPEAERFYFLEEWYPKYGNLVPRDIATRAIHRIVYQEKLGIRGQAAVYLDVTHIPRETLDRKLEGILEIYEKFVGADPLAEPMKIFPAVHYSMGGLWMGFKKDDKRSGDICGRRMRIPVSRANRLGGTRSFLAFWRRIGGPGGRKVHAAVRVRHGINKLPRI